MLHFHCHMVRTGYLKVILQHKTAKGGTTPKELDGWAAGGSGTFHVHLHLSEEMDFQLLYYSPKSVFQRKVLVPESARKSKQ